MRIRALFVLLLAAVAVLAQPPQPASNPAASADEQAKQICKLEGKVLNAATGEPVRRANLTLRPERGGTNLKASSDNEGKFSIEKIEAGRYTLAAERQGFVTQNYGARRPTGPGTVLEFKTSQEMKDLAFRLTPQGVIAGRVLDDEGEPLAGISVQALQYRYVMGKKRLISTGTALVMTNDLGEYRVSNLSPGRYYIATSPQRLMDIQSGTERSAAKTGQEEGNVPTYYPNGADPASASPVDVGPGAEVRGIDVRMRKARVFRVSGRLLNGATGGPMSPAMVVVFRRESGNMSTVPSSMYVVQGDKANFELRNLSPGAYNLMATSTNPSEMMITMTSLDVPEHDVENLVITLGSGAEVPVTAKFEGTLPNPPQANTNGSATPTPATQAGPDLSSVRVVLNVEDNPLASLATTQIGKDNKGVMKRVNPEKFRLIVAGLPPGTYLKAAKFGEIDALEAGLDLRQGASGNLELLIAGPAAELTGVARNDKGEPFAGAIVTLVPTDTSHRKDTFRSGTADQNGNIHVRGIVPGEYKVFAWEDIDTGAAEDEDFRKPFDSKAVKVKLAEGSNESVVLTIIPRDQTEEQKAKQ